MQNVTAGDLGVRRGNKRINRQRRGLIIRASALAVLALTGQTLCGQAQVAQQVPIPEDPSTAPQIDVAGAGIATLDLGKARELTAHGHTSSSQINISDSALVVSASQRLYHKGIGSFSLGGLTTDASNAGFGNGRGTQLFLHQAFLDYQAQHAEAYVGRTDTPTAQLVTFPTLRGDDLVTFTNVLNPFSNGDNLEEHRYANVASYVLNQKLTNFENFHVQHLIDSSGTADTQGTGLNSYGVSFQHLGAPSLEAVQRVVSYGAGFEHRNIGAAGGDKSDVLYGGGVINLRPGVTKRLDLRVQDIYSFGNNTRAFNSIADTYRANSNSIAASLRYLSSPFGQPSSQLALTLARKTYADVPNATSYGLALTGVKRLGQGFDLVAQYLYQQRNNGLAAAYGGARNDHAFQVGFVFNFDATFNRSIGPRRTLTNMRHQYIPN